MVSGFLTSPWDHARMSSAVARPIRNSSKKLTSSTGGTSLSVSVMRAIPDEPAATAGRRLEPRGGRGNLRGRGSREVSPAPAGGFRLVHQVVDRGRLVARQVDSEVGR